MKHNGKIQMVTDLATTIRQSSDKCPFQAGVENGTLGLGCRIIDDNDDDGDFVINEDDQCPNTDVGLLVDLIGCAQNQIDDDGDGVFNDADICSLTPEGESVDLVGCSQAQKEVDTDGDGVFDFLDQCPNTPSVESSNSVGCSSLKQIPMATEYSIQ